MKPTVAFTLFALSFVAQSASAPEFEVASVRIAPVDTIRDSYTPILNIPPGGTLRINNLRLRELILLAYNIGQRQLVGPSWLVEEPLDPTDINRFDIIARVPQNAAQDQIPLMLQKLLADRFHLSMRKDSKVLSAYVLKVARTGLRIEGGVEGERRVPGCRRNIGADNNVTTAVCQSMTMTQLAQQLQTLAPAYFRDFPVVDRTGLTRLTISLSNGSGRRNWMRVSRAPACSMRSTNSD